MGKTNNLFTGIVRKKVGSLVGYRITNSNNGEKQGLRTYVANPKNPKSLAQAIQRCKLGPASRFYRAFSMILDHAFEGVEIGTPSRSHFMSLAMQSATPAVGKGETAIPVFPYIVSQGSLPLVPMTQAEVNYNVSNLVCRALQTSNNVPATASIAQITQDILEHSPLLQDGDEITFMAIILPASNWNGVADIFENMIPIPTHFSVVLDLAETSKTFVECFDNHYYNASFYNGLQIVPNEGACKILAGTFIISRRDGSKWIYSNSEFVVTKDGEEFYNDELVEAAIRSYMDKSSTASSDLILQQATESQVLTWYVDSDGYVVQKTADGEIIRVAKGKSTGGDYLPIKRIDGTYYVVSSSLPETLSTKLVQKFDTYAAASVATGLNIGSANTAFAIKTNDGGGSEGGADVRP